jgi:acetyl esterase/lipase
VSWTPYILTDAQLVDQVIAATEDVPAVPVRIHSPRNDPGDLPLVVFFHGGGYISGTAQ